MLYYKEMPVSAPTKTSIPEKDFGNRLIQNPINTIIPQKINNSTKNFKIFEIDVFSQAKEMLNIRQVLEYYGVQINSKGFAFCPFHQENTPSFKVYDESFYCFGCGESGTVIDFAVKYFGITNIEAVSKLNEDFRLNLSINGSMRTADCRSSYAHHLENKNIVENFINWEKQAFKTLSSYFKLLRFYGEQIFVNHNDYFNKYSNEVENILFIENLVDLMIDNMRDFQKQAEFYRDFGEVVSVIERKLNA